MKNKLFIYLISFLFLFFSLSHSIEYINNEHVIDINGTFNNNIAYNVDRNLPLIFTFKLRTKTKINDSVYLINYVSSHFRTSTDRICFDRFALSTLEIGYTELVHNKLGSISYGKNLGVMFKMLNDNNIGQQFKNTITRKRHTMLSRGNNLLSYKKTDLFNIKGSEIDLQLQGSYKYFYKNKKERGFIKDGHGRGMGIYFTSPINKEKSLTLSGAYFKSYRLYSQCLLDVTQENILDNRNMDLINRFSSSRGLSLKYDDKNIFLSFMVYQNFFIDEYGKISNLFIRKIFEERSLLRKHYYCGVSNRTDSVEILSKLKLKNGIQPYLGFYQSISRNLQESDDKYLSRFVGIGVRYEINEKTSIFMDYKLNLNKESRFFLSESSINPNNMLSFKFVFRF